MENLKQKTIKGALAKICSQGATFFLRVGSLMVMARLLEPRDFGLVGMVTAVIGVLNLFKDFGLSTASVQRTNVTEEQAATLFWINVAVGGALAMIAAAAAPVLATFYREPRLVPVTLVMASAFLFNAAGVQHSARLQREMRFVPISMIEGLSLLVSVIVGIAMAKVGYGYWSLVVTGVLTPLLSTLSLWTYTRWIPTRPHRRSGIRSMMRFGGTVTLNGIVVYCAYNMEKVLLGRFLGAETLGIYGRSYQLISIPNENLNSAVGGVTFSALSRVKDDPPRFRAYFLKAYSLLLALTIPTTTAFALFANEIIVVLLGQKWHESAPIFRLLAPTVLVFALINPLGWLLISLGKVGRSLKVALVLAPVVMAGYLSGLRYGPTGVAAGYSIAMALWTIPHMLWCLHGTPVSFGDLARTIVRPAASSMIAAGAALAVQLLLHSMAPLPRLVIGGLVLAGVYLLVLLLVMGQKAVYLDLISTLRKTAPVTSGAAASA